MPGGAGRVRREAPCQRLGASRTPADALSRYRNALVEGAPPEELARLAEPLDPELLETLHWTRSAGQRAQETPDPRFAKRLERDLLQAFPVRGGSGFAICSVGRQ